MTMPELRMITDPVVRRFHFLLGQPPIKVAVYEACSEEDAWDQAEFEYGSNHFFQWAHMEEELCLKS